MFLKQPFWGIVPARSLKSVFGFALLGAAAVRYGFDSQYDQDHSLLPKIMLHLLSN
jgi:hypothetical protein